MLVDSHCHLDRLDLSKNNNLSELIDTAHEADIRHMLCVSIDLESYPEMLAAVETQKACPFRLASILVMMTDVNPR